ncbi:glycosyl transferase [Loktanella sp. S4079]|nr:glycosyl transferase [Loktanella sp. S4079]
MVPLVFCATLLVLLNPFANPGRLWFWQQRMGKDCKPFYVLKFRTMREGPSRRGAFDPLEKGRVTVLGQFLRRARLDELPQVINVLRGEMSLIGPRPDCYEHAVVYAQQVPGYTARHSVLPGISGYAQTQIGYVDSFASISRKVAADLYYIDQACFGFDMRIAWRTIIVILTRSGR